jgi:hypothetical protein
MTMIFFVLFLLRYPPPFPTYNKKRDGKRPDIWRWKFRDPFWKKRITDWELKWQEALKAMRSIQKKEKGEGEEAFDPFGLGLEEEEDVGGGLLKPQ